jgi:hypothetical protein
MRLRLDLFKQGGKRMKYSILIIISSFGLLLAVPVAAAGNIEVCSNELEVRAAKLEFTRLRLLRGIDASQVPDAEFKAAARTYVSEAEACYEEKYGRLGPATAIDEGGVWFEGGPEDPGFVTFGTKWGADSPFAAGQDVPGPGTPGGLVTYSFMADGVDNSAEPADSNVAISSLPTFSACFITELENGFDAWAAVADITFQEVVDDGLPFNTGAAGDIRIGAHTFDGPGSVLAHGFFPPPNGATAAGDIHFDVDENWDCTDNGSTFDIGIVGIHEIGHALGLSHENIDAAIMNPFYNPAVDILLPDDIEGIESIYGGITSGDTVTCAVGMTEETYSTGEVVTLAVVALANPTAATVFTEWKVWLLTPGGTEFNMVNLGADGSFALPPGYFNDFADPDITSFTAGAAFAGSWEVGCRVESPNTGADFDSKSDTFEVIP